MDCLNWLHLTDLHFGLSGQAPLWPNIKQAFFDDLARLHDRAGPWQVVLFSGDFVQQGTKAEFDKLESDVLGPLWAKMKTLGSEPRLLAVPGNHDLIRPDAKKANAALKLLLRPELFDVYCDDLFNYPRGEYGEIINSAFAEYMAWWRRTPYRHSAVKDDGLLPGDFSVSLDVGDIRIGVLGLNTTFLQLAGGDYTGKLAWDVRQFNGAVAGGDGPGWVRQHDVCLLMTHQGPEWLNKNSREKVYPEINPAGRFAVHLFGHMHENVAQGSSVGGGETLWLWQGNSLFGMEKFGEPPTIDRRHGYSAGQLKFTKQSATLKLWPRKAVLKNANGWDCAADNDGFKLKNESTKSTKITLNQRDRTQANASAKNAIPELTIGERKSLAAYLQAARKQWDIVDLAGLPEDDRHLAMQSFLLRQLFVPLRLTIEAPALEDLSEEAIEQLEQRRLQKRLNEAGRTINEEIRESSAKTFSIGQLLRPKDLFSVPQMVILGDPGGGKTTLLRWLATALLMRQMKDPDLERLPDFDSLPDQNWLPLLIRCRDLDKARIDRQQITLDDVLGQLLGKLELPPAEMKALVKLFRKLLERGEALLLLDGLDEITDPQMRAQFCGWIETVAKQFPSPLVATSRIVGYREMKRRLHGGFEHATLADLSPDDKDDFIRRWCDVTIPDPTRRQSEVAKLAQAVHGQHSDRIERLTGNPMLLTTLALVQRKVGKLPSKRHKLYWEAVNVLLNWRGDIDEPLDPDEALPQLEYVAYVMCDRGVQRLRRDELLKLLEDVRREYPNIRPMQNQSPEVFLAQLERRTALLVETGHEQHNGRPVPIYEFRHLTFQEYLAALALVEGRFPGHNPQNTLAERVGPLAGRLIEVEDEWQVSENWREALRLCVACCNDDDVDAALLAILGCRRESRQGIANAPAIIPAISGNHENRGQTSQPDERESRPRAILAALCLADEPNVSEPIAREILQSFAAQVRETDGSGNLSTGADQAAMELAQSVWRDVLQNSLIREFHTCTPEIRVGSGSLVGMVGAMHLPEDSQNRKLWMEERKTRIAGRDLISAQIAALEVTDAAYNKKAELVPGLINGLIALLSFNSATAYAASWAMYWLANNRIEKATWTPTLDEISRLESFIIDPTTDGEAVCWLCGILGDTKLVSTTSSLLAVFKHSYPAARSAAADALGAMGNQEAVSGLLKVLKDSDPDVRQSVVLALGTIGNQEAMPELLEALKDPEANVRQSVVRVLGRIGNQEAMPELLEALKDPVANVRHAAAGALGKIGKTAVPGLLKALKDPEANVRTSAVSALAEIRGDKVIQRLLSRDCDAAKPWLDPQIPINTNRINKLVEKLKLSEAEIRKIYESIAADFNLTLAWKQ